MSEPGMSDPEDEEDELPAELPYLHRPTYAKFLPHMVHNQPVMLTGLMDSWGIRRWVLRQGGEGMRASGLDVAYLRQSFGHCVVPVVEGGGEGYGEETRVNMTVGEYLDKWVSGEARDKRLYLKDWHFLLHGDNAPPQSSKEGRSGGDDNLPPHPDGEAGGNASREAEEGNGEKGARGPLYVVPDPLADDWLNHWWDAVGGGRDDYRFVYLGPQGSATPMHHDVMGSYSWSGNVMGRKRWVLVPPSESPKLYQDKGGLQGPVLIANDIEAEEERFQHVRRLVVEQEEGEVLFVPSGWHHQVANVSECGVLSINHNWVNACAIHRAWHSFLKCEMSRVTAMMQHHRDTFEAQDWERHCEMMLRANAAINVGDCLSLLHHNLPHLLPPMEDSQSKALPTQQREETADMRHNLLCLLHPINSQSAQREEMNGLPSQGSGSREWQLDQVRSVLSDVLTLHEHASPPNDTTRQDSHITLHEPTSPPNDNPRQDSHFPSPAEIPSRERGALACIEGPLDDPSDRDTMPVMLRGGGRPDPSTVQERREAIVWLMDRIDQSRKR